MTDSLDGTLAPTVRLTVAGDAGRADLAVPPAADVATVLRWYAESVGAPLAGLELRTSAGALLDPREPVAGLRLAHGALLVACVPEAPAGSSSDGPPRPGTPVRPRLGPATAVPAVTAAVAAVLAGGLAAAAGDPWRTGAAGVLAAAVVAVLLLPGGRAAAVPAAPAFGVGAGLALGYAPGPGGLLLGLVAGGLAAVAVAGVARALRPGVHDEALLVWLSSAGLVAAAALAALLVGVGSASLLPVLLTAAVAAALLLPSAVVDVPDTTLVDLDLLAVTAWSARERPRGRRRRVVVRPEAVAALARRSRRLVEAGSVAVAVVVAVTAPVLALAGHHGVTGDGARVLLLLAAATLVLSTRGLRAGLARSSQRLASLWCFVLLGAHAVTRVGPSYWWAVVVVAAGPALLVAVVAVALGRGWRSVWWARAAEVAQTLCVVLLVGTLPVACGLFVWIRGIAS